MVGNLICILLEIYCSLQQWKNFGNPSRIDKVIAMDRMAPFFDSQCSTAMWLKNRETYHFHLSTYNTIRWISLHALDWTANLSCTSSHRLCNQEYHVMRPVKQSADCWNVADKATVTNSAIQYRRPEFYSTVSLCACVDNSTFETVMCKSLQTFVKASIFLLASKFVEISFNITELMYSTVMLL